MAVRLSGSSKGAKRRSYGAYLDEYPEQDFEDAEASRKIAEEAGLPQKKNHLPE